MFVRKEDDSGRGDERWGSSSSSPSTFRFSIHFAAWAPNSWVWVSISDFVLNFRVSIAHLYTRLFIYLHFYVKLWICVWLYTKDLKEGASFIEAASYTKEVRRIARAVRLTIQLRRKLTAPLLSAFLDYALLPGSEAHARLSAYLPKVYKWIIK